LHDIYGLHFCCIVAPTPQKPIVVKEVLNFSAGNN